MDFDPYGRPLAVREGSGRTLSYTYDAAGNLQTIAGLNGQVTKIRRDRAGRVIAQSDSQGRTEQYGYDTVGRLDTYTDPAGHVTHFEYDADSRVVRRRGAGGLEATYEYDACGRLIKAKIPGRGTVERAYLLITRPDIWRVCERRSTSTNGHTVQGLLRAIPWPG